MNCPNCKKELIEKIDIRINGSLEAITKDSKIEVQLIGCPDCNTVIAVKK